MAKLSLKHVKSAAERIRTWAVQLAYELGFVDEPFYRHKGRCREFIREVRALAEQHGCFVIGESSVSVSRTKRGTTAITVRMEVE